MNHTMAWSSLELRNLYAHLSSGYFFSKDTMRFFKSRVSSVFKRLNDRTAIFVTSEQNDNFPRMYTVRKATLIDYVRETDGRECQKILIETLGEFNKLTRYEATKFVKEYQE